MTECLAWEDKEGVLGRILITITTEGGVQDVVVGSNGCGLAALGRLNCGRDGGRGPRQKSSGQRQHNWWCGLPRSDSDSCLILSLQSTGVVTCNASWPSPLAESKKEVHCENRLVDHRDCADASWLDVNCSADGEGILPRQGIHQS